MPGHLTDTGNALRFLALADGLFRHVGDWGHWLHWTGSVWERDQTGRVWRAARRVPPAVEVEAGAAATDDEARACVKWARTSEGAARYRAMLEIAATDAAVSTRTDQWDQRGDQLNTPTGIVDLCSGALHPHDKAMLCSKVAGAPLGRPDECPQWTALLDWAFCGDRDLVEWFQRAVGCSLFGDQREHAFFFCYGGGRNGKGTVVNTLRKVLGSYSYALPAEFVAIKKYGQSHPTELTGLFRARMAVQSEVDPTAQLDESKIKQLSGGDEVTARYVNKDFFSFPPTWKLWLVGNHKPRVRGTDDGIWRRMRLIPFLAVVAPGHEDRDLSARLLTEAPGILAWAVQGAVAWQAHGLGNCAAVEQASAEYRQGEDHVGEFVDDCCQVDTALWPTVKKSDMRSAYESWCREQGAYPLSARQFADRLHSAGVRSVKSGAERRWSGIRLLVTTGERPERPHWQH